MRLHRTTKKGTRYAGTFEKAPSEGLLKALDAVVEAASEFMGKRWPGGELDVAPVGCSCCSDPTPAEDDAFYTAPWCGVCGHPGAAHARPEAEAVREERK